MKTVNEMKLSFPSDSKNEAFARSVITAFVLCLDPTVRDKGCGIADVQKAMEPLFTTAPEEERAGLGFAVMQSFCDRVRVKSEPGNGTVVTLEKYFSNAGC